MDLLKNTIDISNPAEIMKAMNSYERGYFDAIQMFKQLFYAAHDYKTSQLGEAFSKVDLDQLFSNMDLVTKNMFDINFSTLKMNPKNVLFAALFNTVSN